MAEEYVKGRLPQESNPTPGRYPGFVASHDVSEDESQDMRITGKKNPLPSMLYGIDSEGNPKPVNVDENGNVLTQLTGSIVVNKISENIQIPAGTSVWLGTRLFTSKDMTFGIRFNNSISFIVDARLKSLSDEGTDFSSLVTILEQENPTDRAITSFNYIWTNLDIRIRNTSDEDGVLRYFEVLQFI